MKPKQASKSSLKRIALTSEFNGYVIKLFDEIERYFEAKGINVLRYLIALIYSKKLKNQSIILPIYSKPKPLLNQENRAALTFFIDLESDDGRQFTELQKFYGCDNSEMVKYIIVESGNILLPTVADRILGRESSDVVCISQEVMQSVTHVSNNELPQPSTNLVSEIVDDHKKLTNEDKVEATIHETQQPETIQEEPKPQVKKRDLNMGAFVK